MSALCIMKTELLYLNHLSVKAGVPQLDPLSFHVYLQSHICRLAPSRWTLRMMQDGGGGISVSSELSK